MKMLLIFLSITVAGDYALFSGEHVHQLGRAAVHKLHAFATYADDRSGSLIRA